MVRRQLQRVVGRPGFGAPVALLVARRVGDGPSDLCLRHMPVLNASGTLSRPPARASAILAGERCLTTTRLDEPAAMRPLIDGRAEDLTDEDHHGRGPRRRRRPCSTRTLIDKRTDRRGSDRRAPDRDAADRDAAERESTLVASSHIAKQDIAKQNIEEQHITKQHIEEQHIEEQHIEGHVGRGSPDRGARCSTARSGAPDRVRPRGQGPR